MTALSHWPWLISGTVDAVTIDLALDVLGDIAWTRPEPDATKIVDPCTRAVTMVFSSSGVLVKRQARPTFRIPNRPDRGTVLTALREVWRLKGPWTLVVPSYPGGETISVVADPTQGGFVETPAGIAVLVQFGLQEVGV